MTDEAIRALASKIGVEPTLEAIAATYRARGFEFGDGRRAGYGGPECQADRDKAIQRHRAEQRRAAQPAREEATVTDRVGGGLQSLALKARIGAVEELKARHREEFDELHRKARVDLGLPEGKSPTKNRSRLEKLREQLRAAGLEPEI